MVDPGTAIIAGGAIAAGGSLVNSATNLFMGNRTNNEAARLASTAHQREVADLRAAGLNPILSAMGGAGSQTPSLHAPQANLDLSALSDSISSAARLKHVDKARLEIESRLADATIARTAAETRVKDSELLINAEQLQRIRSGVGLDQSTTRLNDANAKMVGARTPEQALYGRVFSFLDHLLDKLEKGADQEAVGRELLGFAQENPQARAAMVRGLEESASYSPLSRLWRRLVPSWGSNPGNPYGGKHSAESLRSH